jgi:RNA 3'-terminal phosphate cyclase (ATP)
MVGCERMLEIDGGEKSGSGTILRMATALACIRGEPLHIYNIRKRRSRPGLRPQHLEAVLTAAKLCKADVQGSTVGSLDLHLKPNRIIGGDIKAEIGTAGSIPMLIMTVLPICAFAEQRVSVHVTKGGTDVLHSPTIHYLQRVLLPTLRKMGLETTLKIKKFGYYPVGMGEVTLEAEPCSNLKPLRLGEWKNVKLRGISVCTFLREQKVAERQARAAEKLLEAEGYNVEIEVLYDESNPLQKGSSLVLWAETDSGVILGGDAIGEPRKPSEKVGNEAAGILLKELRAGVTADSHLADMLIPYIALADGSSTYTTSALTGHLETNIWLSEKILGVKFEIKKTDGVYRVDKK